MNDMTRTDPRGRGRMIAALGILLALGWGASGAALVAVVSGHSQFRPSATPFDLRVAGVEGDVLPADIVWSQGNPTAVNVGPDDTTFPPGTTRAFALAVQNASTEVSGDVRMTIYDPDASAATDLFPALLFTLTRDGETLLSRVPANLLPADIPVGTLRAGESAGLVLTIELPAEVGNDYNGAVTRIGIDMRGESR